MLGTACLIPWQPRAVRVLPLGLTSSPSPPGMAPKSALKASPAKQVHLLFMQKHWPGMCHSGVLRILQHSALMKPCSMKADSPAASYADT